ncbi:FlgD immunoglobulin-like domain containing protein [candidate division KSB1 bacterium]
MKCNKKLFFIIFVVSSLLFVLTYKYLNKPEDYSKYKLPYYSRFSTSPGTKKDPFARDRDQYLRLRNPRTGKIPAGISGKENDFVKTIPDIESVWREKLKKGKKVNSYSWKHRGPYNVAGRSRSLALDIRNENIILSGGASGGIWKSTDNGQNWTKKTSPYQIHSFSYIIQDTRSGKGDTWYCATGEIGGGDCLARDYLPYPGNGIFKSTDNGETWEILESTSSTATDIVYRNFNWIFKLEIDRSNLANDEIYAACLGGIQRSMDGGNTWQTVLGTSGLSSGWWTDVAVTSTGVVYAAISSGSHRGLWRSDDGENWTNITPSGWPSYFRRVNMAVAPSNENVVYFLSDISDPDNISWEVEFISTEQILWKYTYRDGDGSGSGGIWDNRSKNIPGNFRSGFSYVLTASVFPEDENIVFLGAHLYFRSFNGFADTYQSARIGGDFSMQPNSHIDIHQYVYSYRDPRVAYVANDGGISKTQDILSKNPVWERLDKGLATTQFYSVAIAPDIANDKRILAGAQDHGAFFVGNDSPDGKWNWIGAGDGGFNAIIQNGTRYLFGTYVEDIWMTDHIPGDLYENIILYGSWPLDFIFTKVNPEVPNPLLFTPFFPDPNDDKIIYIAAANKILVTKNITAIPLNRSQNTKDQYWSTLSQSYEYVTAIGVSKEPANVVYFGGRHGEIYRIDNSFSENPEKVNIYSRKGLPMGAYVSNIAVDPHNADHAVVSFCNYGIQSIFATWDRGETWRNVSGNLEEYPDGSGSGPAVYWVAILPENGANTYFAGTTTGLYSTRDLFGSDNPSSGVDWSKEGASTIGNVNVKMIAAREVDGEVVIATYGTGIYSRDLKVSVEENDVFLPSDFSLKQNYPNPFNPVTTIEYQLKTPSNITLEIFNINGQLIKTLISKKMSAGSYKVIWDGTNESGIKAASGTYIYRIKAGAFVKSKKMVLMK